MSTDASKFVIMKDFCKAVIDAIELFIRNICVKFIALWVELINYHQKEELDLQRIVSLLAIIYVISFIDLDFIPIVGKIDDIFVIYYAHGYCCNKKQTKLATKVYKTYKQWCQALAIIYILY
eukprot:421836_1